MLETIARDGCAMLLVKTRSVEPGQVGDAARRASLRLDARTGTNARERLKRATKHVVRWLSRVTVPRVVRTAVRGGEVVAEQTKT